MFTLSLYAFIFHLINSYTWHQSASSVSLSEGATLATVILSPLDACPFLACLDVSPF